MGAVQARPKFGAYDNEMTRFRYDAVLEVGGDADPSVDVPWHDWQDDGLDASSLQALLAGDGDGFGVSRIPNSRVTPWLQRWSELNGGMPSGAAAPGMSTEDLRAITAGTPYDLHLSCLSGHPDTAIDAAWLRADGSGARPRLPLPASTAGTYANDPLWARATEGLVRELRKHLRDVLGQTGPMTLVCVDEIPPTLATIRRHLGGAGMRMSTPTDPASIDLDALDLTDPGFYSDGEPHAAWHALRERAPVRQYTNKAGIDYWVVTKFTDVENVLKNHRHFTAQRGNMLHMLGTEDPAGGHQMAVTDPPRHTNMRTPLTRALLMRSVEHRIEPIRNLVLQMIEPWKGGEPFDFAEVMAGFPMAVSGDLMELPEADWPRLTHLTTCSIAADDLEFQLPEGPEETLRQAHRDLFSYFQSIVIRRRRDPGTDLISLLLTIEADGQRLTPSQVVSNCYSLLLGANVTTPQIANAALLHLIERAPTPRGPTSRT